ncbi:MAG: tetratricopeptide repeat protein [Acidobacteriaceae bacterium]|nr:tetratricopeptide repeat protein [Acidobacteriaceae bacterium]
MSLERVGRLATLCCIALLIVSAKTVSAQDNFPAVAQAASAAREAGRTDEALSDYAQAVSLRPDWAEGWWYLGTMQYDRDHYADAIAPLKRLVQLSPNLGSAWAFLGLSEFETRDYTGALAHLRQAQAIGAIDDLELARVSAYHLALLLNQAGEFDQATPLLLSISGAKEPPPQIKTGLGIALLRIPLLPDQIDPSQDALIQAAGSAAAMSADIARYIEILEALIREHPQTPYLHYHYGLALKAAGRTDEALAEQQQEAAISPESALPRIQIATLEIVLRRFPDALRSAQDAVALAPNSFAAHSVLANALEVNGKTQQSAAESRKAVGLAPEKPMIDRRIASMYAIAAGREPASDKASEANPAGWQQAMAAYTSGHYAEAITALKSWVEQKPNDGTAWAVMGLAEFELRDYDNALIHLERGQQLGVGASPQAIALAKYRLAILLIRKGRFETATDLLGPLAGQQPLAAEVQFALGLALLRIPSLPGEIGADRRVLIDQSGEIAQLLLASRYDQAFPRLQKLIQQYPATPFLHYAYGTALDSLSQYDDAKAQMREEIRISPQSSLPWARLASIALRQRLPAEALQPAQKAVQLDPNSADAHYVLGRAYADTGDTAKAIPELEAGSRLSPGSPEIHFALARAYAKSNQPEKANEERATFARLNALAEQQRAQHGNQAYQGAHDAANPSILGAGTGATGAAPPQ